jgi:hypothetical protein
MRKKLVLLAATAALASIGSGLFGAALASSHREAPFITRNPKVDGADYYVFNSYEDGLEGYVTMVANYAPLQDAYGGPNYFSLDPDGLYEIHIDNNGDSKEDMTFQFQFQNRLKNLQLDIGGKKVSVPFSNIGQISPGNTGALNVVEEYTVKLVRGNRRSGKPELVTNVQGGGATFTKPFDNVGKKSIPDYNAYAKSHIYNVDIPGCAKPGRLFVGQRKDPFVVNLGETFDLVNIKNPLGPMDGAFDDLADKNVTAISLEVWGKCLTTASSPIFGSWTTASLKQERLLTTTPRYDRPNTVSGPWVQVSRLSNPLVNEVVIGLTDKDRFNASEPKDDGQFADYVTNPTLPAVLELLFGAAGVKAPTLFPRTDLVAAFLTGVDGLNKNGSVGEMLRLNTSIAPKVASNQNTLGVIGGDTAGFPNGRRPGDDVVDIALRVVMGVLLPADKAPSGQLPFTDGAKINASFFDTSFPYLKNPLPGAR